MGSHSHQRRADTLEEAKQNFDEIGIRARLAQSTYGQGFKYSWEIEPQLAR